MPRIRARMRPGEDLVADRDAPRRERAGHDRPGATSREHPVDPETGSVEVAGRGRGGEDLVERGPDLVDAATRHRVADDDGRLGEGRAVEVLLDLELGDEQRLGIDGVGLRDRDHPGVHAEQVEDGAVLLALGHPGFVGGDHEQRDLDGADAGEHVLDEAHVTGDVDEADLGTGRQRREREPEVDGEAARLLLGEPVGVGAGQRPDQR